MILGQEKLCSSIDSFTLDTFPRSVLLIGQEGSGKHLICSYIANHLGVPLIDITDKLELSTINELYQKVEPHLYIIDVSRIGVKEENLILKFLEEPLKNSYIVLIALTENGILPTVVNRCQVWRMAPYSKELLSQFLLSDDSSVLSVAETPGQLQKLSGNNFSDMVALADKVINKIGVASAYNTLTISDKLAYKGERDKLDSTLFIGVLLNRVVEFCKGHDDVRLISAYMLTKELKEHCNVNNVDMKALFEKYLMELRLIMRGGVV